MSPSSRPLEPSRQLTPQQAQQLRTGAEEVLRYLVETNSSTIYFNDSDQLAKFRTALCLHSPKPEPCADLLALYTSTVDFSTYGNYLPYIQRFIPSPGEAQNRVLQRQESTLSSVLAPGLPTFVAVSSGTSGTGPKYFPKYCHPASMSKSTSNVIHDSNPKPRHPGGSICVMFDLKYRQLLQIVGGDDENRKIPLCLMSSGTFRGYSGWSDVNGDNELLKARREHNTSPLAVSFIEHYKVFLSMHALFALADRGLEMINSLFSTLLYDFIKYIIEDWEVMLHAIETGVLPDFNGVEPAHLKPYLQVHLKPNPERAAELRRLGRHRDKKGWLKLLWPHLYRVIANSSGTFESVVPMLRNYLGDEVLLQSLTYGSSEAFIGHIYDPLNYLNLYKVVGSDDFIEYLPLEKDSPRNGEDEKLTSGDLKQPWELESGQIYELVLTTRDGFWRYRLEDLVKIEGFNPTDGQPIISYQGRRNCFMQIWSEKMSEKELRRAVDAVKKVLVGITEFVFMEDSRLHPRSYGLLVEIAPSPSFSAQPTRSQSWLNETIEVLDQQLRSNEAYRRQREEGTIGQPTIRILRTGSFKAYRVWKIEMNVIGSGQIKIPTVIHEPTTISWLLDRVHHEILAPRTPMSDPPRSVGQVRGISSE